MTLQIEPATAEAVPDSSTSRRSSRRALAAATAVVLAVTGVAVGLASTRDRHSTVQPPKAVLGRALHPLAVYRVVAGRPALHAGPVTYLHVQYAHVRPVVGHWQIALIAPEAATFNLESAKGRSFDVVMNGKALTLFFVEGSSDGTTFSIGPGANWLDRAAAAAAARSLTTSVTVADCSRSQIDANQCA